MSRGICVLLIGAAALLIAGCGGGGDDSTGGASKAESLSKAQFIEQADALCAQAQKAKNTMLKSALKRSQKEGGGTGEKEQEELVLEVLPPIAEMSQQLGELESPQGDEKQVDEIITTIAAEVKELERNPSVAIESIPFEESNEMAAAYGLRECSQL